MLRRLGHLSRLQRWVIAGAAVLVLGLATAGLALGSGHVGLVNPDSTVSYEATTSGAVIEGIQDGGGVAAEGVVDGANGAIGILGYGNNTSFSTVGLEGLVKGPTSTGLYGQDLNSNAASPGVGLLGTSLTSTGMKGESLSSTGIGILANDTTGKQLAELGVNGGAGALVSSGSGVFFTPGLDAESSNNGAGDAPAVFGLNAYFNNAAAPTYGALAYGSEAISGYTLDPGTSTGGDGVVGGEFGGIGSSSGDFNSGVLGYATYGTGVLAEGNGGTPSCICYGSGHPIAVYGVANSNTVAPSFGIGGFFQAGDSNTFALVAYNPSTSSEIDLGDPSGFGILLNLFGTSGSGDFDESGNENLSGHITTAGGTLLKVRGHSGHQRLAYSAQSTVPTLEDYGESQMVNGRAYVRIDGDLGDSMAADTGYLVFITPEGDSNGVYVMNKTPSGFEVRENRGGRDSLAFSYRIVVKPNGLNGQRLAAAPPDLHVRPAALGYGRTRVVPQSPAMQLARGFMTPAQRALADRLQAANRARAAMIKKLPSVDAHGNLHLGTRVVSPPKQ